MKERKSFLVRLQVHHDRSRPLEVFQMSSRKLNTQIDEVAVRCLIWALKTVGWTRISGLGRIFSIFILAPQTASIDLNYAKAN